MDIKLRLTEFYKSELEREGKAILMINNPQLNQESVRGKFWFINEIKGLYYAFIEFNIKKAKQCFYLCGRNDEYIIKTYDTDMLSWAFRHMGYALLSDCMPLIERYANLSESTFEYHKKRGHFVYCAQCVLKEDWDELEKQLTLLDKKAQAKSNIWMAPDLLFFRGFLKSDQSMMEEGIKELVKPKLHKKHNDFFILQKEYLSFPALLYAKLAWLKGFEVEVDSPLVPKELLPHRPNAHYDDTYEFLKELNEDFVPPQKKYITVPFEYQKKVMPKPNGILNYENILLTVKEAAKGRINLDKDDAKKLADMVWLAYTDPKAFDTKHKEFLRDTQIEVARKEGNEVYVYEFPMLREWNLVETEKDHFMNITGMILHEEIPFDENDDWYSGSTIAALFAAQEAQKGKGLSAKLKSLFSQN